MAEDARTRPLAALIGACARDAVTASRLLDGAVSGLPAPAGSPRDTADAALRARLAALLPARRYRFDSIAFDISLDLESRRAAGAGVELRVGRNVLSTFHAMQYRHSQASRQRLVFEVEVMPRPASADAGGHGGGG